MLREEDVLYTWHATANPSEFQDAHLRLTHLPTNTTVELFVPRGASRYYARLTLRQELERKVEAKLKEAS